MSRPVDHRQGTLFPSAQGVPFQVATGSLFILPLPTNSYGYTASYFSDRRPRAARATGGYVRSTHHNDQTALDCAAWWRSLPADLRESMADLVRCEVAPEWEGLLPQWSRRAVAYPA